MKAKISALISVLFLASVLLSPIIGAIQPFQRIPSSGTIVYDDSYSMDYMLQRFYSGRGYGALIPEGGDDYNYFGKNATIHYARREGYAYLADDGTLTNEDPSGTWPTITGGWYAVFNTDQFYEIIREIVVGEKLLENNPSCYPVILDYELWLYNFETIPKSAMKYFLGNLSQFLDSLDPLVGRDVWMIFQPCWEFNQEPFGEPGSGWGAGGQSVIPFCRGWNIPAEDYNRQIKNWADAKRELNITNILLGAHVCKLWSKTYDPYYLEGIRECDIIGASAYWDNATEKFEKLKEFWETVGGNKTLFFFEYNMDYLQDHYADAEHVYETYSLIPQYPMVKCLSWWCPLQYDEATHQAIIEMTAQYNAYKPES